MSAAEQIVQRWFERVMEDSPDQSLKFLIGETDRFRNPVGTLVRDNLAILVRELLGELDCARCSAALAAIVRIRALQAPSDSGATGWLSYVAPILEAQHLTTQGAVHSERIERLTLMAAEEWTRCQELLATVRGNERRRAMAVPSARMNAGKQPCL